MAGADAAAVRVHGTCVVLDGIGVLIRGPSGSGKSDLALRLIDGGARLVADDLTELRRRGAGVVAAAPAGAAAAARGRIELRGAGILPVPSAAEAMLGLVLDLVRPDQVERLPAPAAWTCLGVALPVLALDPFAASAAAKVRLVLRTLPGGIMPPA
ncbi:MAG: hypothetical protein WD099_03470 [Dongiaceae bacterium]